MEESMNSFARRAKEDSRPNSASFLNDPNEESDCCAGQVYNSNNDNNNSKQTAPEENKLNDHIMIMTPAALKDFIDNLESNLAETSHPFEVLGVESLLNSQQAEFGFDTYDGILKLIEAGDDDRFYLGKGNGYQIIDFNKLARLSISCRQSKDGEINIHHYDFRLERGKRSCGSLERRYSKLTTLRPESQTRRTEVFEVRGYSDHLPFNHPGFTYPTFGASYSLNVASVKYHEDGQTPRQRSEGYLIFASKDWRDIAKSESFRIGLRSDLDEDGNQTRQCINYYEHGDAIVEVDDDFLDTGFRIDLSNLNKPQLVRI